MKRADIRNRKKFTVGSSAFLLLTFVAGISLMSCSGFGIESQGQTEGWGIYFKISLSERRFDTDQDAQIKLYFGHIPHTGEFPLDRTYAIHLFVVEGYDDLFSDSSYFHYEEKFESDFFIDPIYKMDPGEWIWSVKKYGYFEEFNISFSDYPSTYGLLKCRFQFLNELNEETYFGETWLEFNISNGKIEFYS